MITKKFSVYNQIYKPEKYIYKGKVIILNCFDKDYVLKEKNIKVHNNQKYLSSRNFDYYVPIIDNNHEDYDVYPYIYENIVPYQQKGEDLAKVVGIMHAKTLYNKSVDKQTYDEIYNSVDNNLNYIKDFYSNLYDSIFLNEFHKPHEILFLDNYSKLDNAIMFSKKELDIWYQLVSDKTSQRVSFIHNNLRVDHLIKGEEDLLISFDNAKNDTPVLDLVKLYKNEYNNLNFSEVFKKYLYYFNLTDDELKLFFILITIPFEISLENDNFINTKKVFELINYINKTEELMRPYYFVDEEEE